jgi:Fe-S-cluster-containing dehydrogenase component
MALTCRLCDYAPCIRACPHNALTQSEKNGVIIVDEGRCSGCGWCIEACKYGSITVDPVKKIAMACDLCEGRKGIGVFPGRKIVSQACIEWCPEGALDLVTRDRLAQRAREMAAINLFSTRE